MAMNSFAITDLKRAIEGRDGAALAGFYASDAVLRIIDRNNPPSKPNELKARRRSPRSMRTCADAI
jgi:hypothetical protein